VHDHRFLSIEQRTRQKLSPDCKFAHESLRSANRECVTSDDPGENRGLANRSCSGIWAVAVDIAHFLVSAAGTIMAKSNAIADAHESSESANVRENGVLLSVSLLL
jgi:hypothetical protein